MKSSKRFGPGLLVTAAFIGPGTITTATKAGAEYGFALLWALVFAVIATIVLQEMAARVGLAARLGLGEALRSVFTRPAARCLTAVAVVSAITLGNAAYQTGNITGAALGLEEILGGHRTVWILAVGVAAVVLLAGGTYKIIERVLMVLVGVMSIVFVVLAVMSKPDLGEMVSGFVTPDLPEGSLTTVIALIGTTVVPYNLFLHAGAVREKWPDTMATGDAIRASRWDTSLSVMLGGVITLAVVVTAGAFIHRGAVIDNAAAMAAQLEPLLGSSARYFFASGLLAAGLTSAVTAPLAAAYATCGVMGFSTDLRSWFFRGVWLSIIALGTLCAVIAGRSPVQAILFAQAANGIILPLMAVFLLLVVNHKGLMGDHVNRLSSNLLGILVVATATGLGGYKLFQSITRIME